MPIWNTFQRACFGKLVTPYHTFFFDSVLFWAILETGQNACIGAPYTRAQIKINADHINSLPAKWWCPTIVSGSRYWRNMHQCSIGFVLWSIRLWFKTGKAWTGRPGNGGRWRITLSANRGHPCLGLAAIFAGMLYNVQIIQKSSTRNIMHVSIIVLELPAKLQCVIDLNGLNGEYYGNDLFCLRSRISEVDTLYTKAQIQINVDQ